MTDLGPATQKYKVGVVGVTTGRRRHLQNRRSDDDFVQRIMHALGYNALELATALSITRDEVLAHIGGRVAMSDYDTDTFWPTLSTLVDMRLAGMIAVQEELKRKMRLDRRRREQRERRVRER